MDVDIILNKLINGILPTFEEIKNINDQCREIFKLLPNVVKVSAPVTICGDIHGQFEDLLELFEIGGKIPDTNYLFLGDYVDRGSKSIEVVTYLFCLKIKFPNHITLIRGNHESSGISQIFGFREEVISRYGNDTIWQIYTQTFNYLPLGALINSKVLCVHGGLSPSLKTIEDIQQLDRFCELPHSGPMCDLVWSDPSPVNGYSPSIRDAGYQFGPDASLEWNKTNGLDFTARGHQLVMSGLEYTHNDQIVTVFSAPDYCGRCKNLGGILELDEKLNKTNIKFETPLSLLNNLEKIPDYYKI